MVWGNRPPRSSRQGVICSPSCSICLRWHKSGPYSKQVRSRFKESIESLALPHPLCSHLSEVEHSNECYTTQNVADEGGEHKADPISKPSDRTNVDQVEYINGASDDVGKATNCHQVGDEDNDVQACYLRSR